MFTLSCMDRSFSPFHSLPIISSTLLYCALVYKNVEKVRKLHLCPEMREVTLKLELTKFLQTKWMLTDLTLSVNLIKFVIAKSARRIWRRVFAIFVSAYISGRIFKTLQRKKKTIGKGHVHLLGTGTREGTALYIYIYWNKIGLPFECQLYPSEIPPSFPCLGFESLY